jgi:hypothetical protein
MPIRAQFETESEWIDHLRMWFAGQALASLGRDKTLSPVVFDKVSTWAYALADSMLAARKASQS